MLAMAYERSLQLVVLVLACVLVHHFVPVQTSEIVIAPEAQTNARIGDTVFFTCASVTYGNAESTVSWSRGGRALLNDSQGITIYEKAFCHFVYSILEICNIGLVDASDGYTCTVASNGTDVDNATFELNLHQIVIAPEAQTNASIGDTVLFTCASVTYDNAVSTVSWNRGGMALLNDSQGITIYEKAFCHFVYSILEICNIELVDASDGYTCTVASNGTDVDNATFELNLHLLCPDPTDPVNGMVTFTGNSVNDVATYTCNTGFELIGSASGTCTQVDAAFSPTTPVCRPLCLDPAEPVNGMVTFTGVSVDDVATYTCNTGFELIGSASGTCTQVDAAFSPTTPVCRPLCLDPEDPVNGMVTFTGNSVNDVATYTCNTSFEMIGSASGTCTQVDVNSAAFSPTTPVCRQTEFPLPAVIGGAVAGIIVLSMIVIFICTYFVVTAKKRRESYTDSTTGANYDDILLNQNAGYGLPLSQESAIGNYGDVTLNRNAGYGLTLSQEPGPEDDYEHVYEELI